MNLHIFGASGALKPQVMDTPIAVVTDALKTQVSGNGGSFCDARVAKAAVALESFSADTQMELSTAVQNLRATIQQVTSHAGMGLSIAQESAAVAAGVLAASPIDTLRAPIANAAKLQAAATGTATTVIGNGGLAGALESRSFALEAYDNKENRNAVVYSVAYNMQAARQDEFGEAFFPTIVVTPDNVGFMVSIRLHYVFDEVRRALSGSLSNFGRKNIIKAVVDASILRNDQTRLVPVVRTGGGANDSTANFVASADVTPYAVTIDGQSVTTAPLKVGKKMDLLATSQTAALIEAGVLDQTDAIDSSLRLSAVYVKIAADGSDPAKVVKFNVKDLPGSDFNYAVQGNTRLLQLNFDTSALRVVAGTKGVDGAAIPQLAALADKSVRLSATLFGSVVQDTGDTIVNAGGVTVAKITTADGQLMDLTAGAGATLADIFDGAEVIGYDVLGYRTNSNRRQRGQLVDTQFVNHLYTVPVLPPITALRPVGETEANDAALLASLITTTKIRTSNAAVGALLEARDILKEFVNSADSATEQPEVLGVARFILNAAYDEDTIDVAAEVDSIKSADRAEDVVALIINKLRDMTYRLYTNSAYKAAADAVFDGAAPKPMVIIGTDPIIARYLTLQGDMRTFGDQFDFKIVQTLDSRMAGKVVLAFGMESSYNSGVANPLHFGNMAWKPELALQMPITRNGQISYELTVQPSFRHVINTPVMGFVTVQGIEQIIADKATVNTSVV